MFSALRAILRDPEGKIIPVWVIAPVLVGTLVYAWLEGCSPLDALYFSTVTLPTVGFGDLIRMRYHLATMRRTRHLRSPIGL